MFWDSSKSRVKTRSIFHPTIQLESPDAERIARVKGKEGMRCWQAAISPATDESIENLAKEASSGSVPNRQLPTRAARITIFDV